ncbi:MAG: hypothetical protein ACRD1H_10895, partial [Vicinamibacterales bacterium]
MIAQQVPDITTATMNRRSLLKRAGLIGLSLPAAGMLLNACSTDGSSDTGRFTPTTDRRSASTDPTTPAAGAGMAELTVTAVDLAFEPTELTAIAGQKVRLTFVNSG